MFRKPLLAFTGVAALMALAFAPLVNPGTVGSADGKASAVAAGADLTPDAAAINLALEQTENLSLVDCVVGQAGPFFCDSVDLLDVVPTPVFGAGHGSDSWGWTDDDGTEYVIVTSGAGIGFFRLAEDGTAGYLGSLDRTRARGTPSGIVWNDVKVVNDHAYITAEDGGYGVMIVDLQAVSELPVTQPDGSSTIPEDGFIDGVQGHNMVAFPERGLVGIVLGEESECGGHLTFYDVTETPTDPVKIGCAWPEGDPNYVDAPHDAHCVVYHGPDPDYYDGPGPDGDFTTVEDNTGAHDICALFSQYTGGMFLIDTTELTRDRTSNRATFVNRFTYDTLNYTHQGWFTDNHRWVMFNDELDESGGAALGLGGSAAGPTGNNTNTTTYYVDVSDLDVQSGPAIPGQRRNEDLVKKWSNPNTIAIDHNMYPVGNLLYQANYGAGLRVLKFSDESLEAGGADAFEEVAYFDTYPGPGPSEFYGAWNVYPFFESGKIILSDFQSGLLVLDVHDSVTDPEA